MALPVVVAQESIADKLVALLKQYASELKLGPAYEADSTLGPVVTGEHKQSVINWINKGIEEGATLVLDGRTAPLHSLKTAPGLPPPTR